MKQELGRVIYMEFNFKDTVYLAIEKDKSVLDVFLRLGFTQFENKNLVETLGKNLSVEMAIASKNISQETFLKLYKEINEDKIDSGLLLEDKVDNGDIKIEGVLPCPVTLPLIEGFREFLDENDLKDRVDYNLKVASGGVNWIKDKVRESTSSEELADIYLSAGFDLFFDDKLMGHYKKENVFKDLLGDRKLNPSFSNDYMDIRDPRGEYSVIGAVPAIFLVNKDELDGRLAPTSWEELFSGDFDGEVALPIGDFDLFNAILLNIYRKYGEDGLKKLGKAFMSNMHPQEMVKSHIKKKDKPTITIMPYFFTKMITGNGPMTPIWPKDGAIISPIFMLTKREREEDIRPIVEFFASEAVGTILAHNGRFPSTNGNIDNRLEEDRKFMWLGWDFIEENDMGYLIDKCEKIFKESI